MRRRSSIVRGRLLATESTLRFVIVPRVEIEGAEQFNDPELPAAKAFYCRSGLICLSLQSLLFRIVSIVIVEYAVLPKPLNTDKGAASAAPKLLTDN